MVAPRKSPYPIRRKRKDAGAQMFTPAMQQATSTPTTPAAMFAGPLQALSNRGTDFVPGASAGTPRTFDWASLAQGLGAGLLTGKNWGEGVGQGLMYARQFGEQNEEKALRAEERGLRKQKLEYDIAKDQRSEEQLAAQTEAYNAAVDALNVPPEQKMYLKAMGPGAAGYGDLFPKAEPLEPYSDIAKAKADLDAGLITPDQFNSIARKETYIAPQAPREGPDQWERYVDPETGRMGQRSTRTGKIDWDPGNSMMAQVGTDAQGNPIFDFVSGAPGPTKEFEAKLANQSMLMGQGLDTLEKLVKEDKVSAARVAGSEQLSAMGPLGEVAGQSMLLSPEDKQYMAARAAAMESLANTITGAAFTEQQKINFMNMLPRPTDDKATAEGKIANMRAYLKELETNAKVSTRRGSEQTPSAPPVGTVEEGHQFMGGDPADPKNWQKLPGR